MNVNPSRNSLASLIADRVEQDSDRMAQEFSTPGRIGSTYIDDLLPEDIAREIYNRFPPTERMMQKKSVKELKWATAQMNECDSLLEESVYAFQDQHVLKLISHITGLADLQPDAELYAGGISLMAQGGYLRPHLDNSHDAKQSRYRVLNLLYYVTPDWKEEYGGSLQLWDEGPHTTPRTIPSVFNRLVLMVTGEKSWHSVNEIKHAGKRCCVSNYYFSPVSPEVHDYFHATSFRGERAGAADLYMQADNTLRTAILKNLPGAYKNPHVYKQDKN